MDVLVEIKEKLVPEENVLDISSTSKLQRAREHDDSQDLEDLEVDIGLNYEVLAIDLILDKDWRKPIVGYLQNQTRTTDRRSTKL